MIVFWLYWPGIPAPAAATLEHPDTFELISISPRSMGYAYLGFHGYPVLGKTTVTDASAQRRIARSIRWGARLNWVPPPFGLACFSPRHAIRVTHGQSTTDFLICFHCRHVEVYGNHPENWNFDICGFPESTLDEILQKAGVPLAPKGD
jgi:hypothetical protein